MIERKRKPRGRKREEEEKKRGEKKHERIKSRVLIVN